MLFINRYHDFHALPQSHNIQILPRKQQLDFERLLCRTQNHREMIHATFPPQVVILFIEKLKTIPNHGGISESIAMNGAFFQSTSYQIIFVRFFEQSHHQRQNAIGVSHIPIHFTQQLQIVDRSIILPNHLPTQRTTHRLIRASLTTKPA